MKPAPDSAADDVLLLPGSSSPGRRVRRDSSALRGSPFAALEACSMLRFVTDELNEGTDALCTALTCSAFRRAVFARFGVRSAGQPHAGKRIVSSVECGAASAARLAWVRSLGRSGPVWVQGWNGATTRTLARLGRLEALQWARANGCDWDWQTCSAAAKGRHAEVLRWAKANGCATRPDEDETTCCDMVACRTWCMYSLLRCLGACRPDPYRSNRNHQP
jgi:hypothetical protein